MIDGVVVLDKPAGITSFRAVERVGRLLGARKCGHAGTLDPQATGVLPVCVGRATKVAGYIAARDKEYDVSFRFGIATDTGDAAGRTIEERPGARAEEADVARAVAALAGTWDQTPPAFSAIKVAGKRAYALARRGKEVVLKPRPVTVSEARLVSWSAEGIRIRLACSKGFYVRALSRDMGAALGVPMTVACLRRLRCGPFRAEEAVTLEALAEAAGRGEAGAHILPIERALADFPRREIPAAAAAAVRSGRSPAPWLEGREEADLPGVVLLTSGRDGAVALVAREPGGSWKILRGI